MTRDTRIALFLMGELVAALRANDSDLFKRWLLGGVQDLLQLGRTSIWISSDRLQDKRTQEEALGALVTPLVTGFGRLNQPTEY